MSSIQNSNNVQMQTVNGKTATAHFSVKKGLEIYFEGQLVRDFGVKYLRGLSDKDEGPEIVRDDVENLLPEKLSDSARESLLMASQEWFANHP